MGYWGQKTFHLLIQSKVGVQKGKGKTAQWTFENTLCQQTIDSIPKKSFNQCFQSFPSICQILLLHKLAKLDYKRISFFACPWSNPHPFRPPFQIFNLGIPFTVKPPLSCFQLDLYFFLFHHFLWFKLPFWVFTLNLFLFSFYFFYFFLHFCLPEPPFQVFNFDTSLPSSSQA